MRARRSVLVVVGALLALTGLGMVAAGAGMLVAHVVGSDADGYLTSPRFELATDTSALTAEQLQFVASGTVLDRLPASRWFDARVGITPTDPTTPVFVGIGPRSEVAAYLEGVAHDQVVDVDPWRDTRYRRVAGDAVPAPPGDVDIWVVHAQGAGSQTLEWVPEPGEWSAVVMNADATAGVSVEARVGVLSGILVPIGIVLLALGIVLIGGGTLAVVAGLRTVLPAGQEVPTAGALPDRSAADFATYPVMVRGALDPGLGRWQWLVKWLLALPHVFVLALLWPAFVVVTLVAGVAILFTGRYPRPLFDFNVGVLRWTWRVTFYAYGVLGTDRYPPFTLGRSDYPADLDVDYPQQLSRGLVLVKWWLLALPHYLVVGLLTGGLLSWTFRVSPTDVWQVSLGMGLIGLLVLIAAVALLATTRYPPRLFDLVMGCNRWVYRVVGYAALMTDVYPPFRLDEGGGEPGRPAPPTAPSDPQAAIGRVPVTS